MGKRSREEQLKNLSLSQKKGKGLTYVFVGLIVAGLIGAVGGLIFLARNNGATSAKELGEVVQPLPSPNDKLHISRGDEHALYNSNPPTNGPHFNGISKDAGIGPIPCQTYTEEVEDESAIHNLEHGVVWVTYKDANDKALAEQLKNITEDYTKVILSPRSKNDSKIAVVSWLRVLKLDSFDEQKIRDFIKLYRSSEAAGEERFASCGTVHPNK
jgi:hypothetical protein